MSNWLLWALAAMASVVVSTLLLKNLAVQQGSLEQIASSPANLAASLVVVVASLLTFFFVFNALRDPKVNPGVVQAVVGLNVVLIAGVSTFLYPDTSLKPTQILAILLAVASVVLVAI